MKYIESLNLTRNINVKGGIPLKDDRGISIIIVKNSLIMVLKA